MATNETKSERRANTDTSISKPERLVGWFNKHKALWQVLLFSFVSLLVIIGGAFSFQFLPASANWVPNTLSSATVVMAIAVVASAIGAFLLFRQTKQTSIDRTSFDIIYRQVHDRDLIATINRWRTIRDTYDLEHTQPERPPLIFDYLLHDRENLTRTLSANGLTPTKFHDFDSVIQLLNYHEAIAIGIKRHALNESIIKDWWRSTIVRDYLDCLIFIQQHRKRDSNDKLFIEFEDLACGWIETDDEKDRYKSQKKKFKEIEEKRMLPQRSVFNPWT